MLVVLTCALPVMAGRRVWAAADLLGGVFGATRRSAVADGRYNVLMLVAPNDANDKSEVPLVIRYMDVPLVADVHHQGSDIAVEVAKYVDKVRINPGLFVFHKRVQREIEYAPSEIQEAINFRSRAAFIADSDRR